MTEWRPSLKSCKIRNTNGLWTGKESGSWVYSTEEPCLTREVVFLLPTFWPGSQPCLLLSLARLLHMDVSALKSVLGSSAQKHTPDTPAPAFPYHGAWPCPSVWLGLHLHLAALGTWTRWRQPPAVLLWAGPHVRTTMRLQAGSDLSGKAQCVVLSLTFPSSCLPCISRHGVCPSALANHPMECGAGQEPWFGVCASPTDVCRPWLSTGDIQRWALLKAPLPSPLKGEPGGVWAKGCFWSLSPPHVNEPPRLQQAVLLWHNSPSSDCGVPHKLTLDPHLFKIFHT